MQVKSLNQIETELSAWNDGKGISLSEWICSIGRYDHFIGYSSLIWPKFREYKNRIYISDFFDEDRLNEMLNSGTTPRDAQIFMNILDLSQIFQYEKENVRDDVILYLAQILTESWTAKLKLDYPTKDIEVVTDNNLDEESNRELFISVVENQST